MFTFEAARRVNTFRLLILILMIMASYSCGFQLRGSLDLSANISPLYIQQNSAFELAREIRGLLEKNKIAVTDDATMANSQLALVSESRSSRVLSVDSRGRAREYLLTYTVNITVKFRQSKEIQDAVTLSRSLLFDPDTVLAANIESETLYRDMRKDAARLILLKLQARSKNLIPADAAGPADNSITGQKETTSQSGANGGTQ